MNNKREKLQRRKKAIRSRILGTAERPRLQVFRSLKHVQVQLIDDTNGKTIATESDQKKEEKVSSKKNKKERAFEVGQNIAKKAKEKKIKEVVFDRSGFLYHGRVKAVADGARKGGLKF